MAFVHGKQGRLMVGKYDVSAYLHEVSYPATIETARVNTLGDDNAERIVGVGDGQVGASGYFDGAPGAIDAIIADLKSVETPAPFIGMPQGLTAIGNRGRLGQGFIVDHEISGGTSGAVETALTIDPDGGVDFAVLLADLAARTGNGNTSGVDNAASSANGGVAVLSVTAFSGFSSVTVKVQHSTDNSTFTDLVSFTAVTAAVAERKTFSGTVNRYLRVSTTVSGSGSLTFAVAAARR